MVSPKVELIAYTNPVNGDNPETTISAAAKLCYSKVGINDILERETEEKTEKFINMLGDIHHSSPLEHLSFTFGIEGVSRALLAQITRHRIASFSVQSQRYVDLSESFKYITPPEVSKNKKTLKLYNEIMELEEEVYIKISKMLTEQYIADKVLEENRALTQKESQALEKKALEDARFVLPNACETKMIVTMNARSLLNFFAHRCCNRAQWEIRDVANQMLDIVLEVAPNVFKKAGAPCTFGKCPEGKMSCGVVPEPRPLQKEKGLTKKLDSRE